MCDLDKKKEDIKEEIIDVKDETDVTQEELEKYTVVKINEPDGSSFYSL